MSNVSNCFYIDQSNSSQFSTKVFEKKSSDAKSEICVHVHNPVNVSKNGNREFHLCDAQDNIVGKIYLNTIGSSGKALFIDYMCNVNKDLYVNVGRALHELAIRESFKLGLEGRTELIASQNSDGFHYKCGYRYQNALLQLLEGKFAGSDLFGLVRDYLKAKNCNQPREEILHRISALQDADDDFERKAYETLKYNAQKQLRREPVNVQECVEYGAYRDLNAELSEELSKGKKVGYDRRMTLCDATRNMWREIIEKELKSK